MSETSVGTKEALINWSVRPEPFDFAQESLVEGHFM